MRGKVNGQRRTAVAQRITPAYAGKSGRKKTGCRGT